MSKSSKSVLFSPAVSLFGSDDAGFFSGVVRTAGAGLACFAGEGGGIFTPPGGGGMRPMIPPAPDDAFARGREEPSLHFKF